MDADGMKQDPGLRAWVGGFWKKVPAGSARDLRGGEKPERGWTFVRCPSIRACRIE